MPGGEGLSGLRGIARDLHQGFTRLALRYRLMLEGGREPRLLYAGQLPRAGTKASGGAVKLAYLAEKFPEHEYIGNILYLVSSALPAGATAWAEAAKAKRIAIVLNQNGVAYPAWACSAERQRVNDRNARLAITADHTIFQSDFCRRAFARWVASVPVSQSIIHNPVDTQLFVPPAGMVPAYDLLLMGSAAQPERIRIPLEAVAYAKKNGRRWRIKIAGKMHWGGAEGDLARWRNDLGIADQVDWHGAYLQAEAPKLYGDAKVLLHMQDKDASPTVPLEAMACGVPVVGIRSGGMPELVPSEAGTLLSVPEDWDHFHYPGSEAVFQAVEENLADRPGRATYGRRWVEEKFSLTGFVEKHARLFSELL